MDFLIKIIGFPATLIHHDTLVLDRWLWLKKRLPLTLNPLGKEVTLLDVGCGSGAYTIGAALRGYKSHGLSWDKKNNDKAETRAAICKAKNATFSTCDVRELDKETDLVNKFDYIICTENIEHIINDKKLMLDMNRCLKPGGTLLLTTPNYDFVPMYTDTKTIPDPPVEDGSHVRIGYTKEYIQQICGETNFSVKEISYCSGYFSQKITSMMRFISVKTNPKLAWAVIFPLRIIPLIFDHLIKYTGYSICLVAIKKF